MSGHLLRLWTLLCLLAVAPAQGEFEADDNDPKQVNAAATAAAIREQVPRSESYFEQAYGYAILPSITRIAVGFGGAYGRGILVEQGQAVGDTSYWQFSSGLQAGAKYFSMIIFFKDQEALEYYKQGKVQFTGQAGVDLVNIGAHGTPAYSDGVAIITITRLGLMAEFSYSGAWFRYKPFAAD